MVSRPLNLTTTPTVRITPTPTPTLGGVTSRQRWPRPHVAANRLDLAPCAQRQAHGLRYSSHRRRPASAGRHTGRHTGRYTNHCTDQCRHLLPLGSGRLEPRGHSSMVDTNPALIAAAHAAARCFRAALGAPSGAPPLASWGWLPTRECGGALVPIPLPLAIQVPKKSCSRVLG